MTLSTLSKSPPRRQAEPSGKPLFCGCGRQYREMRRGGTLVGLQRAGQPKILPGAPFCDCGRKLWRHELRTIPPIHRCDFCNADLGLEELAEASKRDGHCHQCPPRVNCAGCGDPVLRGERAITGGQTCIRCWNEARAASRTFTPEEIHAEDERA